MASNPNSESPIFDDRKTLDILRGSQVYREAVSLHELKQQRQMAAEKRLELISIYENAKNALKRDFERTEAEIVEARKILKAAEIKRSEVMRKQISEKSCFDLEMGRLEHYLKQTASLEVLEEINRLIDLRNYPHSGRLASSQKIEVEVKDRETFISTESILAARAVYQAELDRLNLSILSATDGEALQ